MRYLVRISHWLPIITFCPVNKLPDFLYISVAFEGTEFKELYAVRKRIRNKVAWKLQFMEDVAKDIFTEFPDAFEVKVSLLFSKHTVTITEGDHHVQS